MYVFSYYVQQLSLTSKGLGQFTLAPLVISCSASFIFPSQQARYNDMLCDYRINQTITELRSVVTVQVPPYLVYMKDVLLVLTTSTHVANAGMYKQDSVIHSSPTIVFT